MSRRPVTGHLLDVGVASQCAPPVMPQLTAERYEVVRQCSHGGQEVMQAEVYTHS